MKPTQFTRKKNIIIAVATDDAPQQARSFPSINKAKQESRKLQIEADGALGRGTVKNAK